MAAVRFQAGSDENARMSAYSRFTKRSAAEIEADPRTKVALRVVL